MSRPRLSEGWVFVQFRLTVDERKRLDRVAGADHLAPLIWAKRQLLLAIERHDAPLRESPPIVPFDGEGSRR